MQTTNPLGLNLIDDVANYAPAHDITDEDKVEALTDAMRKHGWQGAPIVVLNDYARAFTGVHRLAAAEGAEIPAPGVDLEELLEACGIDLWERSAEMDADIEDVVRVLVTELPAEIRETYGLDIH